MSALTDWMMPGYLHHIQWSVASLQHTSHKLRAQYGMREVAVREDRGRREVVLQSGLVTFLVSETREEEVVEDQTGYPWLSSGRKGGGETDCVFNICLEVGDVRQCYERMTRAGSLSISPPRDLRVEEGEVTVAVVSSPCSQVIHSLVNTTRYSGHFLPGFTGLQDGAESEEETGETGDLLTHIDHITLVCHPGDSRHILDWYSNNCGMQPFFLSQEEQPGEGTVFEEVGMKLTVSSWVTEWLCREEGVTWDLEENNVKNFKLVVAEPLSGQEESHVNSFLREAGGPGVQHLGLATTDMAHTITALTRRGAVFRKPPHTYYDLPGKQEDILSIGQDPDTFKLHGILIDREPTEPTRSSAFLLGDEEQEKDNYLLQIFSFPLFQADTFFLEIIQRHNSTGFGSGNIRALAESIIQVKREREQLVASLTARSETNMVKSCSQQDLQPAQLTSNMRRANTVQSGLNTVLSH